MHHLPTLKNQKDDKALDLGSGNFAFKSDNVILLY
jgi:hypothetical protein